MGLFQNQLFMFRCHPISNVWDPMKVADPSCVSWPVLLIAHSATNIACDLTIYLLPLPSLFRLQVSNRRKCKLGLSSFVKFIAFIEYHSLTMCPWCTTSGFICTLRSWVYSSGCFRLSITCRGTFLRWWGTWSVMNPDPHSSDCYSRKPPLTRSRSFVYRKRLCEHQRRNHRIQPCNHRRLSSWDEADLHEGFRAQAVQPRNVQDVTEHDCLPPERTITTREYYQPIQQ